VRSIEGTIEYECSMDTSSLARWLSGRSAARVVIETCNEAFTVADRVSAEGHEVCVVPAAVVGQLGVGYRGVKNDVRDAQVLSRASVALGEDLPRVHIPSVESRERQALLTQRGNLVRARTQLINGVKSQLRARLLRLPPGASDSLPKRVRELLGEGALLTMLEPTLAVIDGLTASIGELAKQLVERTAKDPQVQRLKTMPGIGPLTAPAFVAAVDELSRFKTSAQLASYFGLTPGEQTTGGKPRFTGVTKAGKTHVRTLLIQAAWALVRIAPDSALGHTYYALAERRPKQVAITAVARKMVLVLYAMMRDEQPFDPRTTLPSEITELRKTMRREGSRASA
jgi:transposase